MDIDQDLDAWKLCGVYIIWNEVTNRCYIGKTRCIGRRIVEHRSLLRLVQHPSRKMILDWILYGFEPFRVKILVGLDCREFDNPVIANQLYQTELMLLAQMKPAYNTYSKNELKRKKTFTDLEVQISGQPTALTKRRSSVRDLQVLNV